MSDLIKRLRNSDEYEPLGHDAWEAADEIESLTADNERLRGALEEAILWGEFMDLCEEWRKALEETK